MTITVAFSTQTRDEAIKCFAILGKALSSIIEYGETPKIKILIKGSQEGGKSLVIDSIIRTLAVDMSPYKMPKQNILEREPCQSLKQYLIQEFKTASGGDFAAAFYRVSKKEAYADAVREGQSKAHKQHAGQMTLIEFETAFHKRCLSGEDIVIHVNAPLHEIGRNFWTRQWSITIQNKDLCTPQILNALSHLEHFQRNRESRTQKHGIKAA